MGEDDNKKKEGKGFAGLSSLVSDVDTTTPSPAPRKESASSAASTARPAPQPAQPQPQPRQTYQEPVQPQSSGSSGGKWVLGIAAVIGVFWLIGQSNKTTKTPAPVYSPPAQSTTPSYSPPVQSQELSRPAQSKPLPVNTESNLMSGGDGATYRVPSFRVTELNNYKRVAESAQREARNLENQVERQKIQLEDERQQVDQSQQELDALGDWIERQRSLIDDTNQYEIDSFNFKIREYNSQKNQLQYQINNFNTDVNAYNALLQRVRVAEQNANQMVDSYNSKLEQYGTRQ